MHRGVVKWFNAEKGFGLIKAYIGYDLVVNNEDIITEGYKTLDEGEEVIFDITPRIKFPTEFQAVNVIKVRR